MNKFLFVCAFLAVFLTFSTDAHAFNRRNRGGFCNSCNEIAHVQEVVTPVQVVQIYVPTFQFQYQPPTYYAPSQIVGPVAVAQPTQPTYAAPQSDNKIRALAKALAAELNKEMSLGSNEDGPPMVLEMAPTAFQPEQQALNPLAVMAGRCSVCHTGNSAKGNVKLFLAQGVFNGSVNRKAIVDVVRDGTMPPQPHARLTPTEKQAILEWAGQYQSINFPKAIPNAYISRR